MKPEYKEGKTYLITREARSWLHIENPKVNKEDQKSRRERRKQERIKK